MKYLNDYVIIMIKVPRYTHSLRTKSLPEIEGLLLPTSESPHQSLLRLVHLEKCMIKANLNVIFTIIQKHQEVDILLSNPETIIILSVC